MTHCSSINRVVGCALFLLMGLAPLIPQVYGDVPAPVVTSLNSIKDGVRTPVRLAIDQWGDIYVTDPRGGGVNRYNNAGKLQKSIPVATKPLGVAVTPGGDILVSQGTTVKAIDKFNGAVKASFGAFKKANGIAVDSTGIIYVVDSLDNCVQLFNADYTPHSTGVAAAGKPDNSFGSTGQGNGQFQQPTGITYEKVSRQLAVADTLNGRIQFFSPAGVWQKTVGSFGAGPLKFTSPKSIAFEYSIDTQALVRMYVVDTFQANVQALDATTASPVFLRYIGNYGMKPGELVVPTDLIFDSSDSGNNRLIVANGSGALALFGISGFNSGNFSGSPTGPTLTINSYPLATNLTALTLSGAVTNADSVKVNGINATISGTAWSAPLILSVGSNVLKVEAANATGTVSRTITINVIAPAGTPVALTVDSFQSPTKESSITLKGSVTVGAKSVTVNNENATVNGAAWSKAVKLTPGLNNFLIIASMDGYSDGTASINITLDNVAPLLDPAKVYMLSDGSTTVQPVQTITGIVSDASPATVSVSVNGTAQAQAPVNDGIFSVPVTLPLGKNRVAVTATDVAGNVSAPVQRTITYDPQAAVIVVNIPNNAVVTGNADPQYSFTFTAPAGFNAAVTVNRIPVATTASKADGSVTEITWTATVNNLVPGINLIEVTAADTSDSTKTSTVVKTVTFGSNLPLLAVTMPPQDIITARKNVTVVGKATPGSSVSALVNGSSIPVSVSLSGAFAFTVTFGDVGSYEIKVSATDPNGNTSECHRTLIYDRNVPRITYNRSTKQYTATNGILFAKDSAGNFVTNGVSGSGTATLDVSNYSGPSPLNVFAISAGGNSSRDGDLSTGALRKGFVDISDALKALQFSLGAAQPSDEELLYGDIAAINGRPVLDGKIRLDDALTILLKAVDLGQ